MRKAFAGVQVKAADQGLVTAVFGTLGVVDKDGDVTMPGAFKDGAEVVVSAYGHSSWGQALPVGKGVIGVQGDQAILSAEFFLDTEHGKDTFATVKNLGPLGQWSYGYTATKFSYGEFGDPPVPVRYLEELKVFECSPVLIGAGVDTQTLSAKSHLRFSDEAQAVLAAFDDLADRAADVMAKRADKGKSLGGESAQVLADIQARLKRLDALMSQTGESPAVDLGSSVDASREFLRWVRSTHLSA